MNVTASSLAERIKAFYPEFERYNLSLAVRDDTAKNAWVVEISRSGHRLDTYIEHKDAKNCLEGRECVHLSTQIGQFVKNYCGESCAT